MSNIHVEIIISQGDVNNASDWKTLVDALVMSNDKVDSGDKGYKLQYQMAVLKAVQLIRDELENN